MPLTAFKNAVVRILLANRTPESHLAGGAVLNRSDAAVRYSDDLDIFHDTEGFCTASRNRLPN
jgi:hypothetical protein